MHVHTEACVWKVYPSGQQSCTTAKNEREQAKRAAGTLIKTGDPYRGRRQPPDGWEDEFGPAPIRALDREWYDEVIVTRALNRERCGRRPYRLEWAEITRRMDNSRVTEEDVALSTGVTISYVSDRRRFA